MYTLRSVIFMYFHKILNGVIRRNEGLTLVDVVVGAALMLIVFLGLFGIFDLSVNLVGVNRSKAEAKALAEERTEYIRSLPYSEVGTEGGIPSGPLKQEENVQINQIEYIRRTFIKYYDSPKDGTGSDDENGVTEDYKKVKVEMNWDFRGRDHSFSIVSNRVPPGIESTSGGGTLSLKIFDANAQPVENAEVQVENSSTSPEVSLTAYTNNSGSLSFPGSPEGEGYRVEVIKNGYNTAKTYDETSSNPNPDPGHLRVIKGERTQASFAIDKLANKTIRTFEAAEDGIFEDTFSDIIKVSTSTEVEFFSNLGEVRLASSSGSGYASEGYLYSSTTSPKYLNNWEQMDWSDDTASSTEVIYQLYYETATGTALVSESDLPSNDTGFSDSPVDISNLSISKYPTLLLRGELSTVNASSTPKVYDWSISYNAGPTPLPSIPFRMKGTKTVGEDSGGNPIYKYDKNLNTGGDAEIRIDDLEWDSYKITIDNTSIGYDIAEACKPQPRFVPPNSSIVTELVLEDHTQNSLLMAVRDDSDNLLEDVSVKLTNATITYSKTKNTSDCGQTFFSGLEEGTSADGDPYNLEVSASGYETETLNNIEISGQEKKEVVLDPN